MQALLEIVILKCPGCGNLIAEPAWFADLEQDIQCADCKEFFSSKDNIVDRKLLKILLKDDKIENIKIG